MPGNGVTHKELNEALGLQTKLIFGKINRTEDSLKEDISEVKEDVKGDVEKIDTRVTHIERRNRWETFLASIVTFISAVVFGRYTTGGS